MGGYVPGAGDAWERVEPAAAGFDAAGLEEAVAFAQAHETPWSRDLAKVIAEGAFEPPPWNEVLGPVRPRGGPQGLVVSGGRIVAEWGDTDRADMTFSVAKSFISICVGIAHDDGLIPDFDRPVAELVRDGGFDGEHNRAITWRHLLQQTSEWEGTLWDKPDVVDRNRDLKREGGNPDKGKERPLQPAGSYWEYNDVRVNRLALAALRVLGRPLPEVLKRRIMDPVGASDRWEWHGYRNSWVEIGGERMQSVSGGAHWGGGMFIGARDQARVGLLMARDGMWGDRRLLSSRWIAMSVEPCPIYPQYGFMWWLNTGRERYPSAPEDSYAASGAGGNMIWVDPSHDLVVVARWLDPKAQDGFLGRVLAARR